VIILDEPSTGLDPRGMSEVREIVKSLGNRLVFMSSHLLAEVTEVCQEVAMIDHGKLLVYDTIENVTSRFAGGSGEVQVGFARPLDVQTGSVISNIEGVTSFTRNGDRQVTLKFNPTVVTQEALFKRIAALNAGAQTFQSASGLEDAYLSLIKETL